MGHQENFLIALDIDGTITTNNQKLKPAILSFLEAFKGKLVFATGRTFSFALPILADLKREYLLVVQNGAATVQMPQRKVLSKAGVKTSHLFELEPIFQNRGFGLLVEGGVEENDICFFRPQDFSQEERNYLDYRKSLCPETWKEISSFHEILQREFAVGKYFAPPGQVEKIKEEIEKKSSLKVMVIQDPFRKGYFLGHVANPLSSKGNAIQKMKKGERIIACGDDANDLGMLERADLKIAMKKSPTALLEIADIISEPEEELVNILKRALL